MAITNAQQYRQMYRYGGDTMGGPNDKSNNNNNNNNNNNGGGGNHGAGSGGGQGSAIRKSSGVSWSFGTNNGSIVGNYDQTGVS